MLRNALILLASLTLAACASLPAPDAAPPCTLSCGQDDAVLGRTLDHYLNYRTRLASVGFLTEMDAIYQRAGWHSRDQMHAQASRMHDRDRARCLNVYAVTGLLDEVVSLYQLHGESLLSVATVPVPSGRPLSPFVTETLSLPPDARLTMIRRWTQIIAQLTDNMVAESAQWQEETWFSPSVTESPVGSLP